MRKRRRRGTRVARKYDKIAALERTSAVSKTSDGEPCISEQQCRKYKKYIVVASENVAARIACEIASSPLGAKGGAKRQGRDEWDRPAVGAPRVGQGPDVEQQQNRRCVPSPRARRKPPCAFLGARLVPSEERSVDMTSLEGHEERLPPSLSGFARTVT